MFFEYMFQYPQDSPDNPSPDEIDSDSEEDFQRNFNKAGCNGFDNIFDRHLGKLMYIIYDFCFCCAVGRVDFIDVDIG